MAKSLNRATLIGNIGKDPEVRQTGKGTMIVNFSVATNEKWTDKETGEIMETVEWHDIAMFGKLAEIAAQYVKKGEKIYVEGPLCTRTWDDKESGKKMYRTQIIADAMTLL